MLTARAPKLDQALAAAGLAGHALLVIDGTLIPIDQIAADRPFCSGKRACPDILTWAEQSPTVRTYFAGQPQ